MVNTSTDSIVLHLRLSRAFALARQGRWREAERSLTVVEGAPPEHPVLLHALAAVVTSEGDYERALQLWQRLAQHDPSHVEARRMIHAIEVWLMRAPWTRFVPYGVGAALIGVLVLFFSMLFSGPPEPVKNGNLPAGVNAPVVATDPGNPVYAAPNPRPAVVATPTPVPPINFSVPAGSRRRHTGG